MITSPSSHTNMIFHLPVVSRNHHHDDGNDDEEEEETLSLCEYSINSSSDSQNSSFKSLSTEGGDDEDSLCFEFFSQEWSTTTDDQHKYLSSTSSNNTIIFCGKFIPSKEPIPQNIQKRKCEKIESEPTSSKQNLSPLFASSTPSKWYLFFFGITKLRTKMEVIRDIKVRQSRSRRSSSFRSIIDEEMRSTCMAKNKGFWAVLLRTLSCGSVPTIVG